MDTIDMILDSIRPTEGRDRVPIKIDPAVRQRLNNLLWHPEMVGVGYSAFINRACEVAETAIMQRRRAQAAEAEYRELVGAQRRTESVAGGTSTGRFSAARTNLSQPGPSTGAWVGEGR